MELVSWMSAETPVWTLFLVFVGLQIAWTLLVRTFPSVLGNVFLKHLDHRLSEKLERTKAELQGAHAALRASVDFLSTGQAELRLRIISATELLWRTTREVHNAYGLVTMLDRVLLPEEITEAIQGKRNIHTVEAIRKFKNDEHQMAVLEQVNSPEFSIARLYVGDRLWLIAYVTRAVHGRLAILLQRSLQQDCYLEWKNDPYMKSLAVSVLPEEAYRAAIEQKFGGFERLTRALDAEFLREARRVMSGSLGFADALSDVQAALSYERQKFGPDI